MKQKRQLVKLLILLALLLAAGGGAWAAGVFEGLSLRTSLEFNTKALFQFLLMLFGVLLVANLVILVLRSLKPKRHRGRTLVTLIASLTKYAAALVILCWGLSILGVDVSTIVASVGILALIVGFGAESLIADVVTGVFMLFENQCNVGDIVEVGGRLPRHRTGDRHPHHLRRRYRRKRAHHQQFRDEKHPQSLG